MYLSIILITKCTKIYIAENLSKLYFNFIYLNFSLPHSSICFILQSYNDSMTIHEFQESIMTSIRVIILLN